MEGIVDRFEGDKVILEIEKGIYVFNKDEFPVNIKEGDIVKRIDCKFIIKEKETKERKKYVDNLFKSLIDDENNENN